MILVPILLVRINWPNLRLDKLSNKYHITNYCHLGHSKELIWTYYIITCTSDCELEELMKKLVMMCLLISNFELIFISIAE